MTEVKKSGLELLREPFPSHQISKLPKPYKADSQKGHCDECGGYHGLPAMHLSYVGHAALTDRLLDCDPAWAWEPLALTEQGLPTFDESGGLWIKLTVCGITRLGYGHAAHKGYQEVGAREKEVIGDALRNAAMRFGAALDLWHKGQLHVDEDGAESNGSKESPIDPAIAKLFDGLDSMEALKKVWKSLTQAQRDAHVELKDAAKARIAKSDAQALADAKCVGEPPL